ncbi:MAG: biotin--[acetyl-CoA-carboxylase] ligase [Firmicutes bacterium]|nr:biotin--[acetyl-CoA-carboxylase] ligase [Bacillota bacterium]
MEKINFIPAGAGLYEKIPHRRVTVKETTGSTNTDAAELLRQGERGFLIAANAQTGGRGRRGRTFLSETGGIYFSFDVSAPAEKLRQCFTLVTPTAGVAAALASRELYGIDAKIKWVNDIFAGGKKLGGILAEGVETDEGNDSEFHGGKPHDSEFHGVKPHDSEFHGGKSHDSEFHGGKPHDSEFHVIVGIGINAVNTRFPDTATSISREIPRDFSGAVCSDELIAKIVSIFDDILFTDGVIDEYRRLLFILGHDIIVHPFDGSEDYRAHAIDVCPDGRLVILRGGERILLSSGEVSILDTTL